MKLKKIAKRLQAKGTHGDTHLVHVNPKELMMLDQMSGGLKINPQTGLFAGYDQSTGGEQSTAGMDSSPGGGNDTPSFSPGVDYSTGDYGGPTTPTGGGVSDYGGDMGYGMGVPDPNVSPGYSMGQIGFGDFMSQQAKSKVAEMTNNPVKTLTNLAVNMFAGPIGVANGLSGLLGGPTVGSLAQAGVNSITSPADPTNPATQSNSQYGGMFDTPNEFGGDPFLPPQIKVTPPTLPTGQPVTPVTPPVGRPQGGFMGYPPFTGTYAPRPWQTGY